MVSLILALASAAGLVLPAETLDGAARSFPKDADAPRAVFVVTFTKAASKLGAEWTRRLREAQSASSAPVFQVAVLEEVPKMFRGTVISAMKRQIPQTLHATFWTAVSNSADWRQLADSTSPKEPSVFVIDQHDRIVWRGHGEPTDAKIQE